MQRIDRRRKDLAGLADAQARTNNAAGQAATLEKLLFNYPKKDYWNAYLGRLPRTIWEEEVLQALRGFPGYQSIQWLGDDLRMRWLLPVAGNEAALNFRLYPEHPNYPLAMEARESGEQRFSNSFDLVQGGRGFVLYTPLYREQDGTRVFDGFLQGVFRVEPLMLQLLTQIDREAFNLELLENSHSLFRHGAADTDMRHSLQLGLSLLNNQDFSLRLSPTEQLLDQLGRSSEARSRYRMALQMQPNDPSVLSNMGMSFVLSGDLKTAETYLRQASQQPGADSRVRQNLALVVGLPTHLDGTEHELTARCRRFANQLHGRFALPVFTGDERLSSVAAEADLAAAGVRDWRELKAILDAEAARLILQTFLDSNRHANP